MRKLIIPLLFLLVLGYVNGQVITIGISPSEFKAYGDGQAKFQIRFYNTYGEVDAYYTLKADECINSHIVSGFDRDVLVPKGTTINNPVMHEFVLVGNFTQQKICYVYVYGRPVGAEQENGTVSIQRRIGVRMILGADELKPKTTTTTIKPTTTTIKPTTTTIGVGTTTTTQSSSGGGGGQSNTTTTKKTATTTQTTINILQPPDFNGSQIIHEITTTTTKVESEKTGFVNFLLNTTTGLYVLIVLIVIIIIIVGMVITRKRQKNTYNPFYEHNQGIY